MDRFATRPAFCSRGAPLSHLSLSLLKAPDIVAKGNPPSITLTPSVDSEAVLDKIPRREGHLHII